MGHSWATEAWLVSWTVRFWGEVSTATSLHSARFAEEAAFRFLWGRRRLLALLGLLLPAAVLVVVTEAQQQEEEQP